MKNSSLYQAIINRHSIRQYQQEELPAEQMKFVESAAMNCQSLMDGSAVRFHFMNHLAVADMIAAQGPYGVFIVSPHVVLPYCTGSVAPLIEIGFQAEQFCVRLFEKGIGTCYLGTAGREKQVIQHFDLPVDSEMGAAIIFGTPRTDGKRSIANYFRKPGKRTSRKPLRDLFLRNEYPSDESIPAELKLLLTAAQYAPSAVNAQPWRFILSEGNLYLYVTPTVYPLVLSASNKLTYALHDAGIVMANISLALEAAGEYRKWSLHIVEPDGYPIVPADLRPIAKISLPVPFR